MKPVYLLKRQSTNQNACSLVSVIEKLGPQRVKSLTLLSYPALKHHLMSFLSHSTCLQRVENLYLLGDTDGWMSRDFFSRLAKATPALRSLHIETFSVLKADGTTLEGPSSSSVDCSLAGAWPHLHTLALLGLRGSTHWTVDFWSQLASVAPDLRELTLGIAFWQPPPPPIDRVVEQPPLRTDETLATLASLQKLVITSGRLRDRLGDRAEGQLTESLLAAIGACGTIGNGQKQLKEIDVDGAFPSLNAFVTFHTAPVMHARGSALSVRIRRAEKFRSEAEALLPDWTSSQEAPKFRYA